MFITLYASITWFRFEGLFSATPKGVAPLIYGRKGTKKCPQRQIYLRIFEQEYLKRNVRGRNKELKERKNEGLEN